MRLFIAGTIAVAILAGALPCAGQPYIQPGSVAPAFAKNQLAGAPGNWSKGGAVSLGDYAGKVVVLFLLGYD